MAKFKKGDVVRCLGNVTRQFTKGRIYVVRYVNFPTVHVEKDDSGSERNGWHEDNFELVTTSPIRTVTRREIVPGEYGTIGVGKADASYVRVGFLGYMIDYVGLNAQDLRAAASLFNELADVLDENAKEAA